jgi:hypothetical protein
LRNYDDALESFEFELFEFGRFSFFSMFLMRSSSSLINDVDDFSFSRSEFFSRSSRIFLSANISVNIKISLEMAERVFATIPNFNS